jgi:hypothetical protein
LLKSVFKRTFRLFKMHISFLIICLLFLAYGTFGP